MSKSSLFKILILTPLAGLLLAGSAFFISDHTDSAASTVIHQTNSSFSEAKLTDMIQKELLKQLPTTPSPISSKTALGMLATTVKIETSEGSGSGVPVFENKINNTFYTYILTNNHVVRDDKRVQVSKYHYKDNAMIESTVNYPGTVILANSELDLALIELQTNNSIGPMAQLVSKNLEQTLNLTQDIYIASCPLGLPPLLTSGRVAGIDFSLTTVTTFSIYGSSGSGAYTTDGKLVGIVRSIVSVYAKRGNARIALPEPNLTHVIPLPLVISWLMVNEHDFIIDRSLHKQFLIEREVLKLGW